jgi:hypothetical protein
MSTATADLTPEQQAAIAGITAGLQVISTPVKTSRRSLGTLVRTKGKTTVHVEVGEGIILSPCGGPATVVSKPKDEKKAPRGAITRLEAATAKERIFTVNGIKFFATVGQSGHRILTACDESKKTLESAGRVLLIKGFAVDVKRNKQDKTLWLLTAKEKVPSGPWPDEDPKPAAT